MCPENIAEHKLKKILIIGLSCLGDNLLITPAIKKIKETFPEASFDIIIGPGAVDFAIENPWFKEYFVYDKKKSIFKLIGKVRKKRYDLIVDFRNSFLPFFLRGKYKLTFFIKEFFSDKMFTHESERVLSFLEPFFGKEKDIKLHFPLTKVYKEKCEEIFLKHKIKKSDSIVVFCPGANFEKKRWDKDKFAQLGKELFKYYDTKIIVVGSKNEIPLCEEVTEKINDKNAINLAGKTNIRELASILSVSDLLITNDTGTMHLASAVGCPIVAIFGPGNPYRYGPIGVRNYVVHAEIDCFPCKVESKCKIDFECLKRVTVEQVLKAAMLILDEKQQPYLFEI